jgi:outer membrane immunogenic protein
MFGANFGYNFQSGQFVYGVEVSGAWTSLHGDYEKFGWRFDGRVQSYETLTGRFGFLSGEDGSALYYARGGVVWGQYRYTSDWPEISTFFEADKTLTGAAYGIGWERSLWNNWTIKAEYMRYDFGSTTIDLTPNRAGVAPYRVDVGRFAIDSLNIGLNYRFETRPTRPLAESVPADGAFVARAGREGARPARHCRLDLRRGEALVCGLRFQERPTPCASSLPLC